MPTELSESRHLEGLREAMLALVRHAERAGLAAAVPTCPGWTVRDLIAHQGMVHRWATRLLLGADVKAAGAATAGDESDGRRTEEPVEWLADGAIELARALTTAPEDLDTLVFLRDAPPARAFWARRQCHETTMHAVDAYAAALGRAPRAEEVWVGAELAADGIDELLGGFLTRSKAQLRSDEPGVLVVAPDDRAEWWEVAISADPAVTTRHTETPEARSEALDRADWELTGGAVELYLRLWNRAAEPVPALGGRWPALAAVAW